MVVNRAPRFLCEGFSCVRCLPGVDVVETDPIEAGTRTDLLVSALTSLVDGTAVESACEGFHQALRLQSSSRGLAIRSDAAG